MAHHPMMNTIERLSSSYSGNDKFNRSKNLQTIAAAPDDLPEHLSCTRDGPSWIFTRKKGRKKYDQSTNVIGPQDYAIQKAQMWKHSFIVATQYQVPSYKTKNDAGTRKCYYGYQSFFSKSEFLQHLHTIIQKGDVPNYFEILNGKVNSHVDIDAVGGKDLGEDNMIEEYERAYEAVMEQLFPTEKEEEEKEEEGYAKAKWRWSISSKGTKKSLHGVRISNRHYWASNVELKYFMERVVAHIKSNRDTFPKLFYQDQEGNEKCVIDLSVYSKNRAMRIILSSKAGEVRILRPYTSGNDGKPDDVEPIQSSVEFEEAYLPYLIALDPSELNERVPYQLPPAIILLRETTTKTNGKHRRGDRSNTNNNKSKGGDDDYWPNYGWLPSAEEVTRIINEDSVLKGSMQVDHRKGTMFVLKNIVPNRVCIIGGESNYSDNGYVRLIEDTLVFFCHDEGCRQRKKDDGTLQNPLKVIHCFNGPPDDSAKLSNNTNDASSLLLTGKQQSTKQPVMNRFRKKQKTIHIPSLTASTPSFNDVDMTSSTSMPPSLSIDTLDSSLTAFLLERESSDESTMILSEEASNKQDKKRKRSSTKQKGKEKIQQQQEKEDDEGHCEREQKEAAENQKEGEGEDRDQEREKGESVAEREMEVESHENENLTSKCTTESRRFVKTVDVILNMKQNNKAQKNFETHIARHLPEAHLEVKDKLEKIPDPKEFSVLLLRAATKSGKTTKLIEYMKDNGFGSSMKYVVFLSFRQTFTKSLLPQLQEALSSSSSTVEETSATTFQSYEDISGNIHIEQHPFLIIQMESLHRLNWRNFVGKRIDLLVFDECESDWAQFNSPHFKYMQEAWENLQELVIRTKKMIFMDAYVGERSISMTKVILNMREKFRINALKRGGVMIAKDTVLAQYYTHSNCFDYTFKVTSVKENYYYRLNEALKNNKKIFIPTNSRKQGEKIEKYIHNVFPEMKVKMYSAKTNNRNDLKDVNTNWIVDCDVLIITPTITAGISFTQKHFDLVFPYFVSKSCGAIECCQ
ncbi:MAG: hypothetical protein ACXV2C_00005, partial [Candidatus Bathyarchaeia archaeon]